MSFIGHRISQVLFCLAAVGEERTGGVAGDGMALISPVLSYKVSNAHDNSGSGGKYGGGRQWRNENAAILLLSNDGGVCQMRWRRRGGGRVGDRNDS